MNLLLSLGGLVSIPIGGTLLALALTTRRSSQPWPSFPKLLGTLLLPVVITLGITLAICLVFRATGLSESWFYRPSARNYGEHEKLGIKPVETFFASRDGTRLHGWFLPAQGAASGTVIHLHGSDRNITHTIKNSYWLTERGFHLFVFDYRGYGRSEGEPSRAGLVEDAVAAVEYVRSLPEVDPDRLVLWGQSMGGQLAIVAATRADGPPLKAVVAEATYASHRYQIKDKAARMGPLWLIQSGLWLTTSDTLAANGEVARLAPTPLLLVHGQADRGVAPYHSDWLERLAGQPKQHWRIPGAGHLQVFHDAKHRDRLVSYLRDQLP